MMVTETKTTCPYCGVGCGVIAAVSAEGGISIKGDPEHPANFGRLCSKGAALGETLDLEERLLEPQLYGNDVDWNTALGEVASRFSAIIDEHGPDAVAFYVSGQLLTEDYYVANKLMKGYIGSANIDTNSRLCMSSAVAAHKRAFGADIVPCSYTDLEDAELIVITGSNTAWCHPVLYQRMVKAKKQNPNTRIVVIDPRRTATCDIADLHLPLRPGSDAVLFNGLLHYLSRHHAHNRDFTSKSTVGVEAALSAARQSSPSIAEVARQCGLDNTQVERFFDWFTRTERVVTLFSQGVNQSSSGTDKGNAIINCHLLSGRIGRPGMGPFSITGQPNAMGGREVGGLSNQLAAHMELENRQHREWLQDFWRSPRCADRAGLKAVDLFRAVEEGTVRAVWVMATNPVDSLPDADRVRRALEKCELVVVSDITAHTDTAKLAHIRLPALGWGEKDGTVTNSERRISRQRAFIPAPGNAKPDWWIVTEVARRMGYSDGFSYTHACDIFAEHIQLTGRQNHGRRALNLEAVPVNSRSQYDNLPPLQWPVTATRPDGTARLFEDGRFFTDSGRARLVAITPQPPRSDTDERFPLRLNTGRVRDHWHTMTRSGKSPRLSSHTAEPYVELHPLDAASYGVNDKDLARVTSRRADVILRVRLSHSLQRGDVFIPIHWNDQYAAQARVGALLEAFTDPISGQPEMKHTPVRIEAYPASWHGLLVSRRKITPPQTGYWSRSRGEGVWYHQLAGKCLPDNLSHYARSLLCTAAAGAEWVEYFDTASSQYRAARIVDGRLESSLYIGPSDGLPAHDWLEPLFGKQRIESTERIALLAGRPLSPQQEGGPSVCACFGVGREKIRQAIIEQRLTRVEQITAALKAGGNCGSCLPELKELLNDVLNKSAA